jgi:hypothetical protein
MGCAFAGGSVVRFGVSQLPHVLQPSPQLPVVPRGRNQRPSACTARDWRGREKNADAAACQRAASRGTN